MKTSRSGIVPAMAPHKAALFPSFLPPHASPTEVYDLKFGLTSPFTSPKITIPVRGYGLVIDSGIVNKTYITRPKIIWSKVKFGGYINKIFEDDESPAPTSNSSNH